LHLARGTAASANILPTHRNSSARMPNLRRSLSTCGLLSVALIIAILNLALHYDLQGGRLGGALQHHQRTVAEQHPTPAAKLRTMCVLVKDEAAWASGLRSIAPGAGIASVRAPPSQLHAPDPRAPHSQCLSPPPFVPPVVFDDHSSDNVAEVLAAFPEQEVDYWPVTWKVPKKALHVQYNLQKDAYSKCFEKYWNASEVRCFCASDAGEGARRNARTGR
jgi:hypothetical protein